MLMMMTLIIIMMTMVAVVVVVVALSYFWLLLAVFSLQVFSLDTATTSRKLVAHAANVGPFIMCDSDTDLAQEQRKS